MFNISKSHHIYYIFCQITGTAPNVMKALVQVSSCLCDRPSRSQCLLAVKDSHTHVQHGQYLGFQILEDQQSLWYTNWSLCIYTGNGAGECSSFHFERDESSSKVFVLSLLCPAANIARVIGKDGSIINRIRQQSRASIKVDSSIVEDDCIISIAGKEARSIY